MLARFLKFFEVLIFLNISTFVFASEKIDLPEEYSARNLNKFVVSLIEQEDYFCATGEIQRLKFLYPNYLPAIKYDSSLLFCYYNLKQYSLIYSFPQNSKNKSLTDIYKFDSLLAENKIEDALDINFVHNTNLYEVKRKFALSLLTNDKKKANQSLNLLKNFENFNASGFDYLLTFVEEQNATYKSLWLAGFLGIFPGAGYLYAGNFPTGITAFITVAFYTTAAVMGFVTGNNGMGAVFTAISAAFYSGSILGGVLETKKYNNAVFFETKDYLVDYLNLNKDHKELYYNFGIRINVK